MFSEVQTTVECLLLPSDLVQETLTGPFGELDMCSLQLEGPVD